MKRNRMMKGINVLLLASIAVVVGWGLTRPPKTQAAQVPTNGHAEVIVQEREVINHVEVEREITAEMLRESLKDMGVLVTQEYDFTEVVNFRKEESRWIIFKGKAGYIGSYDGVITAGIDFEQIRVEKNENDRTVTVVLPKASIQNVDIDFDSFTIYEESSSWGTHVTAEEYAGSLSALETNAKIKAIDRGMLAKADENAVRMVRNFVAGLIDTNEYTVQVISQ